MSQTEETVELKENQFIYNNRDGKVTITVRNFGRGDVEPVFSYGDVMCDSVQKLRPKLYKVLLVSINDFKITQDKILKDRQEKKDNELLKKNIAIQLAFKLRLETEVPELMKLHHKFARVGPRGEPRSVDFYVSTENSAHFGLYYSKSVPHGTWRSKSTEKVWKVEDPDYKTRRYKNLKSIERRILREVKQIKAQKVRAKTRKNVLEKFCEDVDLVYKKGWKSQSHNRGYSIDTAVSKEYEYEGKEYGDRLITLYLSRYEENVTVTSIEIRREKPFKVFGNYESREMDLRVILKTVEEVKEFLVKVRKILE